MITTRLTFNDCTPIFTKIKARINSWATQKLSYGRRLQLVKSILNSIHLYWSNLFILPATVTGKIESMLSSFQWFGEIKQHYGARVCWKDICKPKKERGLGIIRLKLWNQYLIMKQIWNICLKKRTLCGYCGCIS